MNIHFRYATFSKRQTIPKNFWVEALRGPFQKSKMESFAVNYLCKALHLRYLRWSSLRLGSIRKKKEQQSL